MKKITLVLFSLLSVLMLNAQIDKELVIIEIGTGTWCQYCPGAAMGADDLIENGHSVAIIENHNGDSFTTDATNIRNNYYNISAFPSTLFNGLNIIEGGYNDQSLYPSYLPKYNSAIAVQTSFDVNMEVAPLTDNSYSVTVTIEKVHDYSGTNLVAHLVVTESHIDYNWQGQSELNFVTRGMYPDHYGTSLDFSEKNQEVFYFEIVTDEDWDLSHGEIVAFVQDNSSKEILNGTKATLNLSIGTNNASCISIEHPTDTINTCGNSFTPSLIIKNRGSEALTSLTIEYDVNEETTETFSWTGNLAFGEEETVELNEITFTALEDNTLNISLIQPNGQTDDEQTNNSQIFDFHKSPETTTHLILDLVTGNWGVEISWDFQDASGTVLYSGSGEDVYQSFYFTDLNECIYFSIYDSYGNGFNTPDGYFELKDSYGQVLSNTDGNFGYQKTVAFIPATLVDVEENITEAVSVYPNPTANIVNISLTSKNFDVKIYNSLGKVVVEQKYNNTNTANIDCSNFENGVYFIEINNGSTIISEKITVIK